MPSPITFSTIARHNQQKQDGTIPIKICVTYLRKTKFLPTSLYATPKQLDKQHKIIDKALREAADSLVMRMREAAAKIDPYALEGKDVHYVASCIEEILRDNPKNFTLDFPEFFEKIASEKSKYGKANMMSALHSLSDFLGTDRFDISVLSSSTMRRYERYLIAKYGENARAVSAYTHTIAQVHNRARQEYNNEESDEVFIKNPFDYYKCPRQKQAPHRDIAIEIVEKMLAMREELTGRERTGVDLFLIGFALMGMNTPDIFTCRKPIDDIIIYNRTKTMNHREDRAEMHVRIEPCVKKFLAPYRDNGSRTFNFHRFYKEYQYLGKAANLGLKKFSERIGVPKIDVYSARHTWATIAGSSLCGIDKATVNDCLVHVDKSLKVTDIYIKKDWKIMWKANAKVLALFDWPR